MPKCLLTYYHMWTARTDTQHLRQAIKKRDLEHVPVPVRIRNTILCDALEYFLVVVVILPRIVIRRKFYGRREGECARNEERHNAVPHQA